MILQRSPRLVEPEIHFLEKPVRFSFAKCDTRKWCIQNLEKKDLQRFYERMGHLESCTWGLVRQMTHDKGISFDKKGGLVHQMLSSQMPGCSAFGHFRVNGSEANTRIFVGMNGDLGYILMIDRDGEVQH